MSAAFNHILESILHEPDQIVRDLTLISPHDEQEILSRNTTIPPLYEQCVHDSFRRQAASQPKAPAISSWDGQLTYGELDTMSDQLALHLFSLGVGPGVFVPFCFEKSKWVLVAILGILKAGGACVPLEPSHPAERMFSVVRDVSANVLVSSPIHQAVFDGIVNRVVPIGQDFFTPLKTPAETPSSGVRPSDPCYLIFSSGSTGKPKGSVWEHQGLSTAFQAQGAAFDFTPASRCLNFASYVWDASVWETLLPLITGGCVCVPSQVARLDNLAEEIRRLGVNRAALTPTVARLLDLREVPGLKRLVIAGESVSRDNIVKWSQHVHVDLAYGVSEGIVCNSLGHVDQNTRPDNIGHPVACRIWLTQPSNPNKLVPIGAVGEILIEGPALARGYLNDPARTDASFIWNPEWSRTDPVSGDDRRFYRSGDWAKYNPDWTLSLIGRGDSQIKVRGQRLEVQEVEHHVADHVLVRDAVVCYPKGGPYKRRLVAVLSLEQFSDGTINQSGRDSHLTSLQLCAKTRPDVTRAHIMTIQNDLTSKLPSYMIPNLIIAVEDLPRNTSFKLDRGIIERWLNETTKENAETIYQFYQDTGEEEPTVGIEQNLQLIWSQILNIPPGRIYRKSSFLRMGGDSITAIQLVAACRAMRLLVSVQDIMLSETLQDLAKTIKAPEQSPEAPSEYIESHSGSYDTKLIQQLRMARSPTGLLENAVVEHVFPASAFQKFALAESLLRTRGNFNYHTFEPQVALDVSTVKKTCEQLVDRHSTLRSVFAADGRQVYQVVLSPGEIDFTQVSDFKNEEVNLSQIILDDMKRDFSLGSLPIRFLFVTNGSHQRYLIIGITHAVFDRVSLSLIFRDFQILHQNLRLPPVPSFDPFLRFKDQEMSRSKSYWREYLEGSDPTNLSPHIKATHRDLLIGHMETILPNLASVEGIDLASSVKAAWALTLARVTGTLDVVFNDIVIGRRNPVAGIEKMTGVCANFIPLRVKLDDDSMTNDDVVRQIQRGQAASIPHENLDIDMIYECTNWSSGTAIGSTVNFVRQGPAKEANDASAWVLKDSYSPPVSGSSLNISSQPVGSSLKVEISFCPTTTAEDLVADIFEQLCAEITNVLTARSRPLSVREGSSSALRQRVLALLPLHNEELEQAIPARPSTSPMPRIAELVERVWRNGLGEDANVKTHLHTSYSDLWSDPIAPAYLVTLYRSEGFGLCVEDILDHPTMGEQIDLLTTQNQSNG